MEFEVTKAKDIKEGDRFKTGPRKRTIYRASRVFPDFRGSEGRPLTDTAMVIIEGCGQIIVPQDTEFLKVVQPF